MKRTLRAQRLRVPTIPTNNGLLEPIREYLRENMLPRRHTALLVALVFLFVLRPLIGDIGFAPVVFSCALLLLMLLSLYTVQVDELVGEREVLVAQKRMQGEIGWLLAIPAIAERVAIAVVPTRSVIIIGLIFWLFFFIYITWNELRAVLRQREVTGETISMSISIYLLLGLIWSLFYVVLYYVQPHAFNFGSSSPPLVQVSSVLFYFSLATISTVGYGDITPLTLQARYAAVAEGITGQFYLAILVARLVGLYMSRTASHNSGRFRGACPNFASFRISFA